MKTDRKVAVIAGGLGSVGRAVAEVFAHEQYRVVVLYRHSSAEDIVTVRDMLPGEHLFIQCDIRSAEDVARAIDKVLSSENCIDVAVHAATDPIVRDKIFALDAAAFRQQFESGFFGAFNFFKSITEVMKRQRHGTLVGITSSVIESPTTPARMGAYAVSKIALRGLLREVHREVSSLGIRVFAVAPGLMRTGLNADLPERLFEMVEENQGGVLMTPTDVAHAVVKVCSDTSLSSGVSYLMTSGDISPL